MFGTQNLSLFLVSAILLNLTPGRTHFTSWEGALRRGGLLACFPWQVAGCFIHTLAAAFGLSAILATSASAFIIVKLAGAAYLVYLGGRMLVDRSVVAAQPTESTHADAWAIFRAGFLTNVLNPKVALFYLAFLPQFVRPSAPSKIGAFLFLGGLFITTGTCWCLLLAYSASAISRRLQAGASTGALIRRATGGLFVGLGAKLAVTK